MPAAVLRRYLRSFASLGKVHRSFFGFTCSIPDFVYKRITAQWPAKNTRWTVAGTQWHRLRFKLAVCVQGCDSVCAKMTSHAPQFTWHSVMDILNDVPLNQKKKPQWMAATSKGIYIESNCSKSDLFKPESPGRFSIFHIQESFLRSAPKRNKQLHHSTRDKIDRISPTKSYIYIPFWCKFTNISSCGA